MSYPGAESVPREGKIPPPPGIDIETAQGRPESNFKGVSDVHGDDDVWMKKGGLVLIFRAVAMLFSFLSFILMITLDLSGSGPAYGFLIAISVFVMVYTAVLVGIKGHQILTGQQVIAPIVAIWIEFIGDQILALLLLSSASACAGREPYGQTAASVAMCFMAFFALEPAALISGYNFAFHFTKSC